MSTSTIGNVIVNVDARTAHFVTGMAKSRGALNGFAASVRSTTAALLPFTTAIGSVATVGKSLKLAGEFEQASVAMKNMLKSSKDAQMVLGQLSDFAVQTPFELTELIAASRSLVGFGFAAKDILPTMQMLGDIAAGVGQPIGEMAVVFGKARVQGRAFARDIHELTNRGVPVIQALAKQFGVADDAVMKLVEDGKVGFPQIKTALESLTAKGGQFAGLMEEQSKTMLGAFSNLRDQIGILMRDIGQSIDDGLSLRGNAQEWSSFLQLMRESNPNVRGQSKTRAINRVGDLSMEARKALQVGDAEQARAIQRQIGQVKTFFGNNDVRAHADRAALMIGKRIKALELAQALGVLPGKKFVAEVEPVLEAVKGFNPDFNLPTASVMSASKIQELRDKQDKLMADGLSERPTNQRPSALQAGTVEAFRASQMGRLDQPLNRVAKFNEQQLQEAKSQTRALNDNHRTLKSIDDKLTVVEIV